MPSRPPSPRRRSRLSFEPLETRQLLTAAQLIDLNTTPLGDGPDAFASIGGDVYFQQDGDLWRVPPLGEPQAVVDDRFVSPEGLWRVGGYLLFSNGDGIWSFDPGVDEATLVIAAPSAQTSFRPWGDRMLVSRGDNLWLTDGTATGTKLSVAADRHLSFIYSAELGGELLFSAYDDDHGHELWKVDAAGDAGLVKDIWAGGSSSRPTSLIATGGWVYFTANDGEHGPELWRSDGTEQNTTLAHEFYPGDANVPAPTGMSVVGDYVYYAATSTLYGRELHRTHAATGATSLAADALLGSSTTGNPLSSNPQDFLIHDGAVFFTATNSAGGRTAMKYDPQAAALVNLTPGLSREWMRLYEAGGQVYIVAANRGVNSNHYLDWQVLLSDGTAAGTTAVDTPALFRETTWPAVYDEGAAGLTLTFVQTREHAVWRLTPAGVSDIGAVDSSLISTAGIRVGDYRVLSFTSFSSPSTGLGDLWAVNLADNTLAQLGQIHEDTPFIVAGGRAYYNGWDGQAGHAVWATDGTDAGTAVVVDLDARTDGSTLYYGGRNSLEFNGEHYFAVGVGASGAELWASDGSPAGTRRVAPTGTQRPQDLTEFDGSLYFIAGRPGIIGLVHQLWRVAPDGTAEQVEGVRATRIRVENGALYLEGAIGDDAGLFRNDGGGFQLVRRSYQVNGTNGDFSFPPVEQDGRVFYHFGNIYREDLYVQDLATGAWTKLADARTIAWMRPFGEGVIFSRRDNNVGDYDMWYTDGTVDGTRPLTEFTPAHENSSTFLPLFEQDGYYYFRIETAEHGYELWRNQGTPESGELVMDIRPGEADSFPTAAHVLGDRVLFIADDGVHGREWWVLESGQSMPRLLTDIAAGEDDGVPSSTDVYRHGDYVYFTGYDPEHGREAWRTDGTAAGTVLLHDVWPGPQSSQPRTYSVAGGRLFYHADDGVHGREVWALPLDAIPTPGDYDADGFVTASDHALWRSTYGSTTDLRADGNRDGRVDAADYTVWRDAWTAAPGDYNADGAATATNHGVWRSTYGSTTDLRADGNGDGRIDAADYTVWRDNLAPPPAEGRDTPTELAPQAAPLASSLSAAPTAAAANAALDQALAAWSPTSDPLLLALRPTTPPSQDAAAAELADAEPNDEAPGASAPPLRALIDNWWRTVDRQG
ncbi:hypothetical protein KOR34_13280 [Posidoniimonas corsicana]|uniref:Uncharacterized protein n=1 Tax=Posidoniimonas corsicana TaxID=1938618 RepID=A0A5C5VEH8_9BACT|nr:hypothetical protein [Posidoniimonas corsicana]TWT36423.1 hypothetical protein KOR34_13280 [Posidoniimonas corsicana]